VLGALRSPGEWCFKTPPVAPGVLYPNYKLASYLWLPTSYRILASQLPKFYYKLQPPEQSARKGLHLCLRGILHGRYGRKD
jgi:hypothetical protein